MNRPAPVEIAYKNMRFLIAHSPTNASLNKFLQELKKNGVLDWPFNDGAPPPSHIVDKWLKLIRKKFRQDPGSCIAVHCVAGLGRAPVLVAVALIEHGMKYEDAVQFIRQKRRGAFNRKQLLYLEKYRPTLLFRLRNSRYNCFIQ
ncbi:protein tyrosine phosphatase type IVA 2-like isoform X1 [Diceros bicornis minor]|uniref:protein tyrosine phosphatase type IVA 2-like isoform X1 n=1 Tax=Diceros bicornis minor TaxID=77932 RepID=UPI0026EA6DD1|nr:protein tyrosine phosphatase type IVA 2-like isoform X1 [Diceros bicornis minor]